MVCNASVTSWFQAGAVVPFSLSAVRSREEAVAASEAIGVSEFMISWVSTRVRLCQASASFFFQFDLDVLQRDQLVKLIAQLEFGAVQ